MRRYLILAAATMIALLAGIVAVDAAIDPFGLWRPGDLRHRAGIWWYPRLALPLHVTLHPPATVILGSSRARDGLNPADLAGLGEPVFDYGVSGLTIHEAEEYARQIAGLGSVRSVIIGVDFFWFNGQVRNRAGFETSVLKRWISPYDLIRTLASHLALWSSYTSLTEDELVYPNGFHARQPSADTGNLILNSAVGFHNTPTLYAGLGDLEPGYAAFDRLLGVLTAAGIKVRIFMSPEHALMTDLFYLRGLDGSYEDWKRHMTGIAAAHDLPLWDFSGFNSITMTPLPDAGSRYFDGSHYTPRIGCLILRRIEVSTCDPQEQLPEDFGVRLDPAMISSYLVRQRARHVEYEAAEPDTMAKLRILAHQSNLPLPPA